MSRFEDLNVFERRNKYNKILIDNMMETLVDLGQIKERVIPIVNLDELIRVLDKSLGDFKTFEISISNEFSPPMIASIINNLLKNLLSLNESIKNIVNDNLFNLTKKDIKIILEKADKFEPFIHLINRTLNNIPDKDDIAQFEQNLINAIQTGNDVDIHNAEKKLTKAKRSVAVAIVVLPLVDIIQDLIISIESLGARQEVIGMGFSTPSKFM